jgi:hypothetical protein
MVSLRVTLVSAVTGNTPVATAKLSEVAMPIFVAVGLVSGWA